MNDIICWWSGGVTSAVACKKAIELFGLDRCRIIMIDTRNEDGDTYRFKNNCEVWYEKEIESISAIPEKYSAIWDVWRKHKSLNTANGAICSTQLKRKVREDWQKNNKFTYQVFGYEFDTREFKRALSMTLNHEKIKPIYPLLMFGLSKKDCLDICEKERLKVPRAYKWGFHNNNCMQTGCVQGGIGYWQKMHSAFPDLYKKMAKMEHELTDAKGEPVTMLKDQSKQSVELAKKLGIKRKYAPLFLEKHPDYPEFKTVMDKKTKPVEPLIDCNGFCGVNDLSQSNPTELELNLT